MIILMVCKIMKCQVVGSSLQQRTIYSYKKQEMLKYISDLSWLFTTS